MTGTASEQTTGCWTREYWLDHCEGYRVSTRRGHLGFVEEIVRDPTTDEPTALMVSGSHGERGLMVVPIAEIVDVRAEIEDILVAPGSVRGRTPSGHPGP